MSPFVLFNFQSRRLTCCPERRSIHALHNRIAHREAARFLDFHIIFHCVAAFAQAVDVEYVAGVAGSYIVAYVVVPVVAESGAGG